jgi:hypothetical protein
MDEKKDMTPTSVENHRRDEGHSTTPQNTAPVWLLRPLVPAITVLLWSLNVIPAIEKAANRPWWDTSGRIGFATLCLVVACVMSRRLPKA